MLSTGAGELVLFDDKTSTFTQILSIPGVERRAEMVTVDSFNQYMLYAGITADDEKLYYLFDRKNVHLHKLDISSA